MKNSVVMNITKVFTEIQSIMLILSGKVIVDISLKKVIVDISLKKINRAIMSHLNKVADNICNLSLVILKK